MDKKELRKFWRSVRDGISPGLKCKKEEEITKKIISYSLMQGANSIFVYVSYQSEPSTISLIEQLIKMNKIVAVPLCDTESNTMLPVRITSLSQLKEGAYGILEPVFTENADLTPIRPDLVIVPGLCFDKEGYRLGYGGGYYDRFLENFTGSIVGIAFSECITDILPRDKYDCRVDVVITDNQEGNI